MADYCKRWKIVEFALFGSVLGDDFGLDSDIDVLMTLEPDRGWSLFDWLDVMNQKLYSGLISRNINSSNACRGVISACNNL
ncbi:nucleotidyltransferase family protein [Chroogloeocystis siderophila]|uniref:Polymerase nucleotidyl transferase domain-containing protein n=1 Tax=Chroogloeocystis siderophila 5.2 s.c.1 TaxID=247279 RepID=A0A1U7HYM3_9CHRO|nr:nucleotidyltransferase domain-containing protein [Chroogloeocystis siderophila]OKH28727.1 hypothetical protein NIES1031_02130 [Chroogloeocystis siderophila 5.2 s.c.1]